MLDIKYTVPVIVFLLVLQFKDVFFTDPDPDPDFFRIASGFLADPDTDSEKNPDPKRWLKFSSFYYFL